MLFGFSLPENFNRPYLANSFQEFWRRWHITLSSFFKNFVYIPLGGNRISKLKTIEIFDYIFFNISLAWCNIKFFIWGFLHGLFLTFEKLIKYRKLFSNRFITFILLSLTWVPFLAKSFADSINIISSLFVTDSYADNLLPLMAEVINLNFLIVFFICICSLIDFKKINFFYDNLYINIVLLITSIYIVLLSSVDPFIYFKF